MKRIRHCSCRHLPERPDQFAALLSSVPGLSQDQLNVIAHHLYGLPAGDRRHDRALRHVSVPDPNGHIHWLGPRPLNAGPHVQLEGRRMPAAHYLWLRAGRPDTPLVRTCHDPDCIAPDHHTQEREPAGRKFVLMHAALADFDARHPKINYRPKRWDNSDPTGERCLRASHPLRIYGDPSARTTYCPLCAFDERKRLRARSMIEAQVKTLAEGLTRSPVSYPPEGPALEDIPDGPTLVDQLLESGVWDE